MHRRYFATVPLHLLILVLFFGMTGPASAVDFDLSLKDGRDLRVFHDAAPAYPTSTYESSTRLLGRSARIGDFSGDGQDDIVIGSPWSEANPAAGTLSDREGVVFFIKGPVSDGTPNSNEYYDLASYAADGSGVIFGRYREDHLGMALELGDVNGDGDKDLVLASASALYDTGEVYVLFSGGTELNPSDDPISGGGTSKLFLHNSTERADVDIIIENIVGAGFESSDSSAISLAVGDINGDTRADIVIGAPRYNSSRGAVFIVIGQNVSPLTINASSLTNNVIYRIDGAAAGDRLGASVAVADVTGGSRLDIIMGAPGASSSAGKVYVLAGAALSTWNGSWAASNSPLDIATESASLATVISGATAGAQFGRAVCGANLNGTSGFADIIAGEPFGGTSQAGNVYVFAGATTLTTPMTTAAATMKVLAANTGENFGWSLHAADWNGDGIADLLVGAPEALDPTNSFPVGRAYMIPGATTLPATFDLSNGASFASSFVVYGETVGGRLGTALGSGFLSARSSRDMLVTAEEGKGASQTLAGGAAYNVYYVRGPNAPADVSVLATPTRLTAQSFSWTHDDPQNLPQVKYQAQFANDTGFTVALQESGEVSDTATTWGTTLSGGDGDYYYRVRTANTANFGPWSGIGSFRLDTVGPSIAETSGWNGGTHNTSASRTVTLSASDGTDSPAETLEVIVWRSRQAEDLSTAGVCDPGDGYSQVLSTASPVGSPRTFSFTVDDTGVAAGETVRIWVVGNDRAGNSYSNGNFGSPVAVWTVRSPLGPVADQFSPALPSPDAVYVQSAQPLVSLRLLDDDTNVDTSSVVISFQNDTIGVGLTPASPLWFNPASDTLRYDPTLSGTSYSPGTFTVILAAADDAAGNPLQNPTRWEFVIDTTPPSTVNDEYALNGGFFPIDAARAIRVTAIDNLRADNEITMKYWRAGVDDTNGDGVIDDPGEVKSLVLNYGGPAAAAISFDASLDESSMSSQGTVSIWFSGTDHAGNAITAGVGGDKDTPKIFYTVYDTQGPTVVSWNPVKPGYFNAIKPSFQFTLRDLDAGVDINALEFQVNATIYRVTDPTPALTVSVNGTDATFTYASNINYPEGTMSVWIRSAQDLYSNFIAGTEDTAGVHIIDITGPYAVESSPSPADGSTTSNRDTQISFQIRDNLSGVDPASLELTLGYQSGGAQQLVLTTADPRLVYSGDTLRFTPDSSPFFAEGTVTVTLSALADLAGNPGQQSNWSFQFAVNTSGPQASNLYPVNGLITANSTQEVRVSISSGGSAVDTDSILLHVAGIDYTPASAALTWDSVNGRLSFKPSSIGLSYGNGTVAISLKTASDILGFALQDAPVNWSFVVDTTGPVLVNRPGSEYQRLPTAEVWVTDNQAPLKFAFEDAPAAAGFNTGTLNFRINGQLPGYGSSSAGVTVVQEEIDAGHSGLRVSFSPAAQGIVLPQGTVTVSVTALSDIAGNVLVSTGLETWSFQVDSVAPIVNASAPSGYLNTGSQTVSFSLTEATSGIDTDSVVLRIDGAPVSGWTLNGTDVSYTPPTPFSDGTVSAVLSLTDRAGNPLAATGAENAFKIDTIRPFIIGGESPSPGGYASDPRQMITLSVGDTGSGIDPNPGLMVFQVKDGSGGLIAGNLAWNDASGRIEWTPSVDYPEGTVNVTLSSIRDRAGWDLAAAHSWTFYVDRSGPVASDLRPVTGEFVRDRRRTVEISLTDNLAGIDASSIRLDVNGDLYSVGLNLGWNSTLGKLSFWPPHDYPDGTVTVTLTVARDTRGLDYTSVPYPLSASFLVDATPPTAAFVDPTGSVTGDTPVEASLTDQGFGMDTSSIYFIISAEGAGQLFAGAVDGSTIRYDGLSLIFNPAAAGISYPNDTLTVSLVGADRFGNQLNGGTALEHRFLKDNAGPLIETAPVDSRTPGPNTQAYTADTTEIIRFRLLDLPSGVDPDSISLSVSTQDSLGTTVENIVSMPSSHLSYDAATGWVTYDPSPDQNYPTVCEVTVHLLQARDLSLLAINTNPNLPEHRWSFQVNNSFSIASQPSPPAGSWIADRLGTVSVGLANEGGIDPASIVFIIGGVTREVGVFSTHSLVYDTATERLVYVPTLAIRHNEGTVSVVLTRALDVTGLSDLPGPFSWNFFVDSQLPSASPDFPLPDQAISDSRATISIHLTDVGSGIQTIGENRITLKIRTATDPDWVSYRIGTSPYISYDGDLLRFNATNTFVFPEGLNRIRLELARDRAGNLYSGFPLEYSFSVNTVNPTLVSWNPSEGGVVTDPATPVQFTIATGIGSAGIDTASIRFALRNNAMATIEVDINDVRLSWDAPTSTLTFIPGSDYDEGTVTVALLELSDLEGHPYDADFLPFGFQFLVDRSAPVIGTASVTPMSPGWATDSAQAITIPVNDGPAGSGIDLSTVQLQLSYPGSGGTFSVGIGDGLSWDGSSLRFVPTVPYAEGTASVLVVGLRDRAGFDATPLPWDFRFGIDLYPPLVDDASRLPAAGGAVISTREVRLRLSDTSSGIDPSTLQLSVLGSTWTMASGRLSFDPLTGWLVYDHQASFPEGSVPVILLAGLDRAGWSLTGDPSGLVVPLYAWDFMVDSTPPTVANPVPQPGSYKDDPTLDIFLQLRDTLSGVDTWSVTLLDASSNPIAHSLTFTRATGVLKIDPADNLPSGSITVRVDLYDRAGNRLVGAPYSWQFHVDVAGPVVNMSSPTPGVRTRDNLGELRFSVDESSEVVASTIRLTVQPSTGNSSVYTTSSSPLNWNAPLLVLTPEAVWPDGTVHVFLEMRDSLNHPIAGDSSWSFVIDTRGPKLTPATDADPAPGAVSDRRTREIELRIADALGVVDGGTISFRLKNAGLTAYYGSDTQTWDISAPGLSWTAATGILRFVPADQGFAFGTGEVVVSLLQAKDDIGNELQARPVSWSFTVVEDQPFVTATNPAAGAFTRDTSQDLAIDIFLPQSTNLQVGSVEILLDWADGERTVGVGLSASVWADAGLVWDQTAGRLNLQPENLTPPLAFPEGSVAVTVTGIVNSLGRVMPGDHRFEFVVDTTPPLLSDPTPVAYVSSDQEALTILVEDGGAAAGERIDPASISLRLETGTQSVLFAAGNSGIAYDPLLSRIIFQPASSSPVFRYSEGSVSVTVLTLADKAGNGIPATWSYGFTLDREGPRPLVWSPNGTVRADPGETLEIRFATEGSPIDPASLRLTVANNALLRSFIGLEAGVSADIAAGWIRLHPATVGLVLGEGTVTVEVQALGDAAGNPLVEAVSGSDWEWFLDLSGPLVTGKFPTGSVSSDRQQSVHFLIDDLYSDVDLSSLAMELRWWNGATLAGTRAVSFTSPGVEIVTGTDGVVLFRFDPKFASPSLYYAEGTLQVVLSQARDSLGNAMASGADRTLEILINTEGPMLSRPDPTPGTVLGGSPGTIAVDLQPTLAGATVVPSSIGVKFYGLEYLAADHPTAIRYVGTTLYVHPSAIPLTLRDGELLFEVSRALDSYGNRLKPSMDPDIGSDNAWAFTIDLTGPTASSPQPPDGSIVGGAGTPEISLIIRDFWSAIDPASVILRITPEDAGIVNLALDSWEASSGLAIFRPAGQGVALGAGRNDLALVSAADVHGHPLQAPLYFSYIRDVAPPEPRDPYPAAGATLRNRETWVSLRLVDALTGIDESSIAFSLVNGTLSVALVPGDPGLSYAGGVLLFNPVIVGLRFNEGTVTVRLAAGLADSLGNRRSSDYSWSFRVVSRGPYAANPSPADGAVVADPRVPVRLAVQSEISSIVESSLRLRILGQVYDTSSPALSWSGGYLQFDPTVLGLQFPEGSLSVSLIAAEDLAGNSLEGGTYRWSFLVDSQGPEARLGVGPVSADRPTHLAFSLHFREELQTAPQLKVTDGRGSVETLLLAQLSGTTTVWLQETDSASLVPPLSFRYSATDLRGNSFSDRAMDFILGTVAVSTGESLAPEHWHLLAVPVAGPGRSLDVNLGGLPLAGRYGFYSLDRALFRFGTAEVTIPGLGYVFRHQESAAVTLQPRGWLLDQPMLDFRLGLTPGWNLVSLPWFYRIRVDSLAVEHGGTVRRLADAAQTVVEPVFFGYELDSATGLSGFTPYGLASDLAAWRGYFVYARDTAELRIPPAFLTADELNARPVPPPGLIRPADSAGFLVRISARDAEARDDWNSFGLLDQPAAYTWRKAPVSAFEPWISLHFREDGSTERWTSRVKATGVSRESWLFRVESDRIGQEIVLGWTPPLFAGGDRLQLTDLSSGASIDMTRLGEYRYTAQGARDFRIVWSLGATSLPTGGTADTVKPRVIRWSPTGLDVGSAALLRAVFSEAVDPGTVGAAFLLENLYAGGQVGGSTIYDPAHQELLFRPDQALVPGDYYRATLQSSILDLSRNALDTFSWNFRVSPVQNESTPWQVRFGPGWHLAGFPRYPVDAWLGSLLPAETTGISALRYQNGDYRFYDPADRNSIDPVQPGIAYWLRFAATTEISLAGARPSGTSFRIPLAARDWNQFAHPFEASVAWNDVRFDSGTAEMTIAAAAASGYLLPSVYHWKDGALTSFRAPAGSLEAGSGYFLYSNARSTLIIPAPAPAAVQRAPQRRLEPHYAWYLQVKLEAPGVRDLDNYAGVDSVALDGFDLQDVPELEPPPPCAFLRFLATDNRFSHLSRDIRAPRLDDEGMLAEPFRFPFEVVMRGRDLLDGTLGFVPRRLPPGWKAVVVDRFSGERLDVTLGGEMRFRSYEPVRAFMLEVGP